MIVARKIEAPDEIGIITASYLEGLIINSTFDHDTQEQMIRSLNTMSEGDASNLESLLSVNQLDSVRERGIFTHSDLMKIKF